MDRHLPLTAFVLIFLSCSAAADGFNWNLPEGVDPPPIPADNPMSDAKVELGRRLFHDIRLSGPGYMACATCHQPDHGFADPRPKPIGMTGQVHPRNAPGLANVAYFPRLTWVDPNMMTLEDQARIPMFSTMPVEMAIAGQEATVLRRLSQDAVYVRMFNTVFPESGGEIDFDNIVKAIGAFVRTLNAVDSPYDRAEAGGAALPLIGQRGQTLFFSERAGCAGCHTPPWFSDFEYHNAGIGEDAGLADYSGQITDAGRFRTPSLRNVAMTAPYFHDGSSTTLEDALLRHASHMTPEELATIGAFLHNLSDPGFATNRNLRTPFTYP